jgi:hypothetical protein
MTPSTAELEASENLQASDIDAPTSEPTSRDVHRLLKRLSSGERVLKQLTACGRLAIGPLREFLFNGEPSLAYQPRKTAVEALAALGARQTLLEYLNRRTEISDPAARLGEQAVQAATARELLSWRTPDVCEAILGLAEPTSQVGVVEALREIGKADAIPYFIRALEDDACRVAAEDALRRLAAAARPALLGAALTPLPSPSDERQASVRRRASAINLLAAIGVPATWWPVLRPLIAEHRPEVVVAASRLAATTAPEDKNAAMRRLLEILPEIDWFMQTEVEALLVQLDPDGDALAQYAEAHLRDSARARGDRVLQTLRRLQRRFKSATRPEPAGHQHPCSTAGTEVPCLGETRL